MILTIFILQDNVVSIGLGKIWSFSTSVVFTLFKPIKIMSNESFNRHLIEPHNAAYNPMDEIFRLIMGDFASISNSWPGEYGAQTKENVEKAQQRKYEEYFKGLGLKENAGMKIFEIGPGWGPFSNYCLARGVDVTSVCPAKSQYEYLKKSGHNVHRSIWQEFTPALISKRFATSGTNTFLVIWSGINDTLYEISLIN